MNRIKGKAESEKVPAKQELTNEQHGAVSAPPEEALKIFAGAGTGKTLVLTERYLHFLKEYNFTPEQVLVLTFTRKAAQELRYRVFKELDDPQKASRAEIWNFDQYWWRLLTGNPHQSGIDDQWRIVEETELKLFQPDIIRKCYDDPEFLSLLPLSAIKTLELQRIISDGFKVIPFLKLWLVDVANCGDILGELCDSRAEDFSEIDNARIRETIDLISVLYRNYQDFLEERQLLDFGDVMMRTYRMLYDNNDLAEYYRSSFRHILVDETQDTNPAQFEILKLIAQPGQTNVTVVGDDKQSIYGFRGTSPDVFRRFQAAEHHLHGNFRSPNEVLDLATDLICRDSYWTDRRDEIALVNEDRGKAETPVIFLHAAESRKKEAEAVVGRVRSLLSDGAAPDSIALLFRTRIAIGYFEQELQKYNIPFQSVGGSFYQRPEVKDGLALLKLLVDSQDVGSLSRILERPPLSFSVKELHQVLVDNNPDDQADLLRVVNNLKDRIRKVGGMANRVSLPELLYQVMVHSGVLATGCLDSVSGNQVLRNSAKLLRLAMSWNPSVVYDPLDYFVRLLEYQVVHATDEEEERDDDNCVQLLTVHKAKGLEFDHVFWCDVRSPLSKLRESAALDLHLEDVKEGKPNLSGLGLVVKASSGQDVESTRFEEFKTTTAKRKHNSEEVRLQYVTVTRAKKTLTITCSPYHKKPPKLFETIQELLANNPAVQVDWHIEDTSVDTASQTVSTLSNDKEFWVEQLRPVAASLRSRMKAVTHVPDPLMLTFADLETYRRCPRMLFWSLIGRQVDNTESGTIKDEVSIGGGMDFGNVAHRLLADLPFHPDCTEHFDHYLSSDHRYHHSTARRKLQEIIARYYDLGYNQSQDIRTEVPWVLSLPVDDDRTVMIRGVVDRLHRDDQGWVLLDYKTGRINDKLRDKYFRQLNLYRLAAESGLFPGVTSPRVIIVEIETGDIIEVPDDPDLKRYIIKVAQVVISGDYPLPQNDEQCGNCPYMTDDQSDGFGCNLETIEDYHV